MRYGKIVKDCKSRGGGIVGSAGGKDAARSKDAKRRRCKASIIYVILNSFQDLLTGSKDAKRHRCKANIKNKLCCNFTRITINEKLLQSVRSPFSEGATHVVLSNNSSQVFPNYCEGTIHPSSGTMCHLLPHRGEGIKEILKQVQDDINIFLKRTYSPIHLFTYSHRKRAAFTLAEVLITLGIIGVVAAMTIPSLIQQYKIQEYVSKLNKFYTVISNAYIRAKQDNGDISGWNLAKYESSTSDEEDFLYYILPYMNVVKFCGKNEKGCFPDITYGSIGSAGFGLNLNTNSWYSNAVLNDGMYISSLTSTNTCGNAYVACALLRVDVNGDAPPNKMGIDLHTFAVYKDRILPGGLSGVLDDEQSINRGDACTAHVIYKKNMDYIKDGKCEIYE